MASIPIESPQPGPAKDVRPEPTARELYYGFRQNHADAASYKQHYRELRDAVKAELEQQGFCTLIDSALEQKTSLSAAAYAALQDLAAEYGGEKPADAGLANIPHLNLVRPIYWLDGGMLIQHSGKMHDTLTFVRQAGRKKHVEALKARAASPGGEDPRRILADAKETVNKVRAEVDSIRNQAQIEADAAIKKARNDAANIVCAANSQAETIVQNARLEAQSIAASNQKQAKEKADALVREYLADEQKKLRRECDESVWALSQQTLAAARSPDEVHAEMCGKTNEFHKEWVRTMDEAIAKLDAVRGEFYRHLHDWQVALYPREIGPLAERFQELYRIVNVEKIVREEIVFQSLAGGEKPSPGAVAALEKLNRTLTTFLRRFETALNGLGLYAFYPEAGEAFDAMQHECEDSGVSPAGKRIAACIVPGIKKKAADGLGDDVVVPASVTIEEEGGA